MTKKPYPVFLFMVIAFLIFPFETLGFDKQPPNRNFLAQAQEQIYGYQLMTEQERIEFQNRMRNAATPEEREKIRREHHERMKERAKQKGVTLPDEPPARGMMRRGMEPGQGMGPGKGGMGSGGGGMGYKGGRNQ